MSMNSLPRSMQYSITGSDTVASVTRLHRWDSTSTSYVSESNNIAHIPVSADGFISASEGYLYFTVTNNSTTQPANLDGNANCFINKLEISVMGSSGKVETIENYANYALLKGAFNNDLSNQNLLNNISGAGTPAVGQVADGKALAAGGGASSYAVKLDCSGFLNDYYQKALPQGLPQFTITITFNTADVALNHTTNAAARTYTISNLRWYAPVYNILDNAVMEAYTAQLRSSGIAWIGECCSSIISTRTATAGTQSFILNPSFKSLNCIVSAQRPSAGLTTYNVNTIAATNLDNVSSFQYKINGMNYPSDGIDFTDDTDQSRAYLQAASSFAPHGKSLAMGQQVTVDVFNETTANNGKGVMAINLRRFDERQLVNCGMDTARNSAPTSLEVVYGAGGAAQQVLSLAQYDCTFMLEPSGLVRTSY
jgi:hypothetical protein